MMSFQRWVIGTSLWLLTFQELVLPGVDGFVVGVGGRRPFSNRVVVDTTPQSQSPSFFSWHLFQAAQDDDTAHNDNDPLADLSEERKANLFQFLLRDLEVENVPLLGCDATQAHVVQAALWTTMAELSDKATQDKACLIFENIPVDALQHLVDDFMELKTTKNDDDGILNHLPELERLTLSLVGKGVGPAILIETVNATDKTQTPESSIMTNSDDDMEALELKVTAAMKSFVDRMLMLNTEGEEVESGPIAYRVVPSANICDVLAGFWSCVCELLALPDEELSTIILSLPGLIIDDNEKARFAAISTLISRSLFVYQGQDVLDLQYMHPTYDRTAISPVDQPTYGHLPPLEWIPAMMKQQHGGNDNDKELSKEDIELSNFQRRSPVPAVIMRRVSQLDDAETATVDLDLGDGRIEKASGCAIHTRKAIRLAAEGKEALQSALDAEISIART